MQVQMNKCLKLPLSFLFTSCMWKFTYGTAYDSPDCTGTGSTGSWWGTGTGSVLPHAGECYPSFSEEVVYYWKIVGTCDSGDDGVGGGGGSWLVMTTGVIVLCVAAVILLLCSGVQCIYTMRVRRLLAKRTDVNMAPLLRA